MALSVLRHRYSPPLVFVPEYVNIYSCDTCELKVEELNIKPKHWKDLLTDEPFVRKDIIDIQVTFVTFRHFRNVLF